MPVFTAITEFRGAFHVSQHTATGPAEALLLHVGAMPYDDADESDPEIEWLCLVADGELPIQLVELPPTCRHVWLWRDGSQRAPPITTYLVQTDVG
jgi:hypothetical protein